MKYKIGDRVRIKSLDWYNENKDEYGYIDCGSRSFFTKMSDWCGKIATIKEICKTNCYHLEEYDFDWTDEMIEGLVEEESVNYSKVIDNGVSNPIIAKTSSATIDTDKGFYSYSDSDGNLEMEWDLPQGYQFVDESGNIINTQKIILEKKPDDKLKLESTKKVREYWSEYARIFIEIYDDEPNECVLTHLYTLKDYRQKGYGKQALIEAELIAKELGCHTAYIKVETNSWMHEWYLRRGYKWYKTADEGYTWLTKNLTGMEKKKEYPKTYEECRDLIEGFHVEPFCADLVATGYLSKLMERFARLIICRDAYWKIAGEEMGLGKPWKPDWSIYKHKFCLGTDKDKVIEECVTTGNRILAFPTEEMRDAFYENFKEEIETVKELL